MRYTIQVNKQNISEAMSNLAVITETVIINKIVSMCPELLEKIYQDDKAWQDDLGNLSDSFAWAVYYRGGLYQFGFLREEASIKPKKVYGTYVNSTTGETLTPDKAIWGRDAAEAFIKSHKPSKTFEIVFVAGMYYATFLEEQGYLGGFLRAMEDMKTTVPSLFKSKRNFYYKRLA